MRHLKSESEQLSLGSEVSCALLWSLASLPYRPAQSLGPEAAFPAPLCVG